MRLPTGVLVWSSVPHKGCSEEEKGNNTDSVQRAEESKFRGTGSMLSGEIGRQLNSQKVGCLRRTPEFLCLGEGVTDVHVEIPSEQRATGTVSQ